MSAKIIASFTVGSSPENAASVMCRIMDFIDAVQCLPAIDESLLRLVVDEALTNGMEHGNRWDIEKNVCVRLAADTSILEIAIEDEGAGFDHARGAVWSPKRRMASRGRGIRLIMSFCEASWDRGGTRVILRFKLV